MERQLWYKAPHGCVPAGSLGVSLNVFKEEAAAHCAGPLARNCAGSTCTRGDETLGLLGVRVVWQGPNRPYHWRLTTMQEPAAANAGSIRSIGIRRLVIVVCALMLLPVLSAAQTGSAITGVVRDGSGGVLPGVTIEASSP